MVHFLTSDDLSEFLEQDSSSGSWNVVRLQCDPGDHHYVTY